MRLDLKTGASEKWDIPIETYDVLGVADGGIVTSRIVSDYPIPLPSDSEMLSAIMQNSTYEFDLTDPATGRPIKKIFEYPCDGAPEGDGYITYTYAGKNGSDFYFIADHMTPSYWTGSSVLCIHSDGTQEDLGIMTAQKFIRPMHQNEALRWFMVPNDDTPRTYTFYDLQGNEIGHNAAPAGVDVALIMEYLLDDGRVVLTLGGAPAHNYAANYATIPADAFLNGSTEYTEMEFVGGVSLPGRFLLAGSGHGSSGTPTPTGDPRGGCLPGGGVRAPRPTVNGMVTVGADARIVFAAARRTGCRAACPHAAVAVSVSTKNKTQPLQCFPHCGGWVV